MPKTLFPLFPPKKIPHPCVSADVQGKPHSKCATHANKSKSEWRGWSQESGVRSSEFGVRSPCPESQVRAIGHIVDAAGLTFRSVFVGNGLVLLLPIFFEVFSSRAELSGCLWEQSASINVYWL